ncbi:uncharacterized protein BYT42DRAFT_616404 [Radiomyces spectabilis]|uniref:uncharacterized protein n=1 Tax=Radiomyces spectabilis TaxID=64574 RepID=UPI002220DD68|nr:uncharacterized protein BYT42DRAFT_616404 [Radiomyces spectabilis]KAI8373238.1 hypothetical protein BYT42DRAFT_616404 [Radiomyces spectabilis]
MLGARGSIRKGENLVRGRLLWNWSSSNDLVRYNTHVETLLPRKGDVFIQWGDTISNSCKTAKLDFELDPRLIVVGGSGDCKMPSERAPCSWAHDVANRNRSSIRPVVRILGLNCIVYTRWDGRDPVKISWASFQVVPLSFISLVSTEINPLVRLSQASDTSVWHAKIYLPNCAAASPANYFLRFLLVNYFESVVANSPG